jgi:hypothetical protein
VRHGVTLSANWGTLFLGLRQWALHEDVDSIRVHPSAMSMDG